MLIRRVVTIWREPDASHLPEDLRSAFTPEEIGAFENSEGVWEALADNCEWEPLAKFLKKIVGDCHWAILLAGATPAYEVWFGFRIPNPNDLALIRLPAAAPLPGDPPTFLKSFYATVGGIRLGTDAIYYGWLPPNEFRRIADIPPNESDEIRRDGCYLVQSNGDGSGEGYCGTNLGFRYEAEGNRMERRDIEEAFAEQLDDWLDREYWL